MARKRNCGLTAAGGKIPGVECARCKRGDELEERVGMARPHDGVSFRMVGEKIAKRR